MSGLRSLGRAVTLFFLATALVGCGGTIYFRGSGPSPTPQPSIAAIEPASPLPADLDAITALRQRPLRLPVWAPNASCPVSSSGGAGLNSGFGVGPAYLSGQDSWYSGGQTAAIMLDSKYSGPLLVRGAQLDGDGKLTVTFADLPSSTWEVAADKERQHGVLLVVAAHTPGGGLAMQAVISSSFWRGWLGSLSTDGPGCFALQVDGDLFTEFIVISVQAGAPPPG